MKKLKPDRSLINLALILCHYIALCQNLAADITSSVGQQLQITTIREQPIHYTVKLGETLTIPCQIENRKQATVIWQYSKNKIPETLTIGYFYYRKDYRIRVIANTSQEAEQSWNLEIRKVKLEDEGYYLCKVMAESGSLKRVVYLRVEVDLHMHLISHHHQHNQPISLGNNIVLVCNTSYAIKESPKSGSGNASAHHHSSMRIMWLKDNETILINDNHQQLHHEGKNHGYHHQHSSSFTPNDSNGQSVNVNAKIVHVIGNNSVLNYKVEYYNKPVLWSKLIIKSFKVDNLGTYTCSFRNQTVSIHVNLENGKRIERYSVLNRIHIFC